LFIDTRDKTKQQLTETTTRI